MEYKNGRENRAADALSGVEWLETQPEINQPTVDTKATEQTATSKAKGMAEVDMEIQAISTVTPRSHIGKR
jgi:hypothetical protein